MSEPTVFYSEPRVPLQPTNAPDKVLVIGATGHVGRIFLEQGLTMFKATEFRVLLRSMAGANRLPDGVVCHLGDVRDVASVRAACAGSRRAPV